MLRCPPPDLPDAGAAADFVLPPGGSTAARVCAHLTAPSALGGSWVVENGCFRQNGQCSRRHAAFQAQALAIVPPACTAAGRRAMSLTAERIVREKGGWCFCSVLCALFTLTCCDGRFKGCAACQTGCQLQASGIATSSMCFTGWPSCTTLERSVAASILSAVLCDRGGGGVSGCDANRGTGRALQPWFGGHVRRCQQGDVHV